MFDFVKYYKYFFGLSVVLVIAAIVLLFVFGLNLGIDFVGGSIYEVRFDQGPASAQEIGNFLSGQGFGGVIVQPTQENAYILKSQVFSLQEQEEFAGLLKNRFGTFEELRYDSIGPVIGAELKQKAYWQLGLVVVGILFYIAYAFRKVSEDKRRQDISSWRMSLAAIAALVHDTIIVLGLFAVLGKVMNVEIDSLFITALLTLLGFSVHDTIVVFDRVRENMVMQKKFGWTMREVLNYSVNQSLARSVNTSMTVIFVLLALAFFGGTTIFWFVIALLSGVAVGTYSSIFIAGPLLLVRGHDN